MNHSACSVDLSMRSFYQIIRLFKFLILLLTVSVFTYNCQLKGRQFGEEASVLYDATQVTYSSMELSSHPSRIQSTCSSRSDQRGSHQKVISFSLYGNISNENNFQRYVVPLKNTVDRVASVYPGWIVRIYHNFDGREFDKLRQTLTSYEHVDLCNASRILNERNFNLKTFPMNWRFLPLVDENVDEFMSRDSDSLILQREVEAVRQWLGSPSTFHIMRDHPSHCTPMLGGLWGAKVHAKRQEISEAIGRILEKKVRNLKGIDQFLLRRHIWPMAKIDSMAHDSYCCSTFSNTRPFPVAREGSDFIGMVSVDANSEVEPVICPRKCRPDSHPGWLYC